MLREAWVAHKWSPVPIDCLPQSGIIIEDKDTGEFLSSGFIYNTDSSIAWLEWVLSNPKAGLKKRTKSLDILIKQLIKIAAQGKKTKIFSSTVSKGLLKLYEKHGLNATDTGVTQVIGRIE